MSIVDEEDSYQVKARYIRNKFGKCPAQREYFGKFYCSRMLPCEQYSADAMIEVKDLDGVNFRTLCKFIERFKLAKKVDEG